MLNRFGKSILRLFLYLIILIVISFLLPRVLPGNPLNYFTGDHGMQPDDRELLRLKEEYALGESLGVQFRLFLDKLWRLDFGNSFYFRSPVADRLWPALKWTALLAIPSMLGSAVIGMRLGVRLGMKPKSKGSGVLSLLVAYQAVPMFLLAAVAQITLSYKLKIFPGRGAYAAGMTPDTPGYKLNVLQHLALPLLISLSASIPGTAIMAYNATREAKSRSYVQFSHFLNIGKRDLRKQYIGKNILPEMLGKFNIQAMTVLSGSLFVEAVFSYPGLGTLLYNATVWRDYALLQALLLVTCTFGIAVNAVFELLLNRFTRFDLPA